MRFEVGWTDWPGTWTVPTLQQLPIQAGAAAQAETARPAKRLHTPDPEMRQHQAAARSEHLSQVKVAVTPHH